MSSGLTLATDMARRVRCNKFPEIRSLCGINTIQPVDEAAVIEFAHDAAVDDLLQFDPRRRACCCSASGAERYEPNGSSRSKRSMVRQAHHDRLDLPLVLRVSKDSLGSNRLGTKRISDEPSLT
jgi:hypothetical protein